MTGIDIKKITSEINRRAGTHSIGKLQEIRKELKNLKRIPSKTIFAGKTLMGNYAYHYGGRPELQFNIGEEMIGNRPVLRHGVAFAIKRDRSLPDISILFPKVSLFNEYIQLHPALFIDMRMWHEQGDKRSPHSIPSQIAPELMSDDTFIFMGKLQAENLIDYTEILDDFDRLLPLYEYVESGGDLSPVLKSDRKSFEFRSGLTEKPSTTVATLAEKELDITLRHNDMQKTLFNQLVAEFGTDNVGDENNSGIRTKIDIVLKYSENEYWFYEIKTSRSPRVCLRLALGQLLEYSFWPGTREASRLIVVGRSEIDEAGKEYLAVLNDRFSIPVEYRQVVVQ